MFSTTHSIERLVPEALSTTATPPGHNHSFIRNDLTLLTIHYPGLTRYYGVSRAWIGSDLRMHVIPADTRFEEIMAWPRP